MRFTLALLALSSLFAAERPVPPPGVPVPPEAKQALEAGLARLNDAIDKVKDHPLIPDVLIFREAVRYALTYNEFFAPEEIGKAKDLLEQGRQRAEALAKGEAPWASATGLVVRGYRSRIDHSIQPYGLIVPADWSPKSSRRWRVDTWFHGRGEKLSEVNFLLDRQSKPGEFVPPDSIVVHLYGRYCNANKFAGEVDLFETLDEMRKHYRLDENRIVVRGFSMGGAAAWHIAAHYPGLWAAAAPGAGFSETAEFLRVFQNEAVKPHPWEQKLWRMYDATEYALNFFNLPLVAYSGEIDRQKQAADIMEKYLAMEGQRMTHVIGPQTGHKYHPDAKVQINEKIDAIVERGRNEWPRTVKFTTFTLAYNRMQWVVIDGMEKHWERATVEAEARGDHAIQMTTKNVTAVSLDYGPGGCPLRPSAKAEVHIDGQKLGVPGPMTDRSWRAHFIREGGTWKPSPAAGLAGLQKRHGLQGPIDDAFLDSFILVTPSGDAMTPGPAAARVKEEMQRAITEWRRQFRGDARVKQDTEVTDADLRSANLILWGDPQSNKVLGRIASKLPVAWSGGNVQLGGKSYAGATHYPALIYPNPVSPARYVVVNSGFTFREYDYLNNARQISKLPDFAVVDATTPADGRWPGRIADGGFFNEQWQLP